MKLRSLKWFAVVAVAALALSAFWGCGDSTSSTETDQGFSVKFSITSVPRNLSIDSLSVNFVLGDTGKPQTFDINLKTGISTSTIMAYPGQRYTLTYKIFAAGYQIGSGADSGTLAKDMAIALSPAWDNAKVDQAYTAIHSGTYLPSYLPTAYNVAVVGKDLKIQIDSSQGKTYRWFVRLGDSVIADGQGSLIDWTPPDSLAGKSVSIKVHVLDGNTIVEEKIWNVQILGSLPNNRIVGIVSKNDTTSPVGSFLYFKYTADGNRDSILIYDTTAFVPSRVPVSTIAYSYPAGTNKKTDPSQSVTAFLNDPEIDSAFTYDANGRVASITVTLKSGTTADSLYYPSKGSMVTRSYAQGVLTQEIRHSGDAVNQVDSIFSDTNRQLAKVIQYTYSDSLLLASKTFVNRGGLTPNRSERFIYNALGKLAIHYTYSEGAVLELLQSETFLYYNTGALAEVLVQDGDSGDLILAQYFQYETTSKAAAKFSAAQIENRLWILKLNPTNHFPAVRTVRAPLFPMPAFTWSRVGF